MTPFPIHTNEQHRDSTARKGLDPLGSVSTDQLCGLSSARQPFGARHRQLLVLVPFRLLARRDATKCRLKRHLSVGGLDPIALRNDVVTAK